MTSQGHARTRLRRAVVHADSIVLRIAIQEAGRLSPPERLLVVDALVRAGDRAASRSIARWHAQWVATRAVSASTSEEILRLLRDLPISRLDLAGALELAGDAYGATELRWLHEQLQHLPRFDRG